jgi:S-adenosylmethionine decarboxylase
VNHGFGPHLMIDGKNCPTERLADLEAIFHFLNDLPESVGMTKISQPHVFPYKGLVPEDRGVTGHVIIAESHLTVHTFVDKGWVFFDVFSCKPFDTDQVTRTFQETFQPGDMRVMLEERGLGFPRS